MVMINTFLKKHPEINLGAVLLLPVVTIFYPYNEQNNN